MKEFFKYANGYVNINDENLFLTNSGNWSETKEINEKSAKTIRQNNVKGFKFYVFLFIIIVLFFVFLSIVKGLSEGPVFGHSEQAIVAFFGSKVNGVYIALGLRD